jgi:hypothetical protein
MIDLVTVVFREELSILKVQAQSVDLYCNNLGLRSIYVIVNDNDIVAANIDPAWWGRLKSLVRIVPRSIFSTEYVKDGWISQQVLKILGSSLSYNTWSLILDAKTILITPIDLNRLFNQDGRLAWGAWPIQPVFDDSQRITNELFDINLTHCLEPGGVPFLFHNNSVRSMIVDITRRVGEDFTIWFQQQILLTEFILYSGYMEYIHGSLDKICSTQYDRKKYNACNICHSDVHCIDQKLHQMLSSGSDLLSVGVHRRAWDKFDDKQKELYRAVLLARHITQAQDLV